MAEPPPPICRLFAEQISYLSGGWALSASWAQAHDFCTFAAAGHHAHLVITIRASEVLEYEVKGDDS